MKKVGLLLAVVALVSFTSFAASKMGTACKDEIAKFQCKGKKEHAIHECLEKHEDHATQSDGFSPACYEAQS